MTNATNILRVVSLYVIVGVAVVSFGAGSAGAQAIDVYFDVDESLNYSEGPPYPSAPEIITKVFDKASPMLAGLPLEQVSFNYSMTPPELETYMLASDSGGGGGSGGTTMAMDCFVKIDSPDPPPGPMAFDMFLKIDSPGGAPLNVVMTDEYHVDSFFDVFFDVYLPDGGIMSHHVHGYVPATQPLSLTGCGLDTTTPSEAFDCYLTIEGVPEGTIDKSTPLLMTTVVGEYVPEPASIGLLSMGGLALLRRRWR